MRSALRFDTTANTIKALDQHFSTSTQLSTELVYRTADVLNLTHHAVLRFKTTEQLQEFVAKAAKYPPTKNDSGEEHLVYNKIGLALKKNLDVQAGRGVCRRPDRGFRSGDFVDVDRFTCVALIDE